MSTLVNDRDTYLYTLLNKGGATAWFEPIISSIRSSKTPDIEVSISELDSDKKEIVQGGSRGGIPTTGSTRFMYYSVNSEGKPVQTTEKDIDQFHLNDINDSFPYVLYLKLLYLHQYMFGHSLLLRTTGEVDSLKLTDPEHLFYGGLLSKLLLTHRLYDAKFENRAKIFADKYIKQFKVFFNKFMKNYRVTSLSAKRGPFEANSFDVNLHKVLSKIGLSDMRKALNSLNDTMDRIVYMVTGGDDFTVMSETFHVDTKKNFANIFDGLEVKMSYKAGGNSAGYVSDYTSFNTEESDEVPLFSNEFVSYISSKTGIKEADVQKELAISANSDILTKSLNLPPSIKEGKLLAMVWFSKDHKSTEKENRSTITKMRMSGYNTTNIGGTEYVETGGSLSGAHFADAFSRARSTKRMETFIEEDDKDLVMYAFVPNGDPMLESIVSPSEIPRTSSESIRSSLDNIVKSGLSNKSLKTSLPHVHEELNKNSSVHLEGYGYIFKRNTSVLNPSNNLERTTKDKYLNDLVNLDVETDDLFNVDNSAPKKKTQKKDADDDYILRPAKTASRSLPGLDEFKRVEIKQVEHSAIKSTVLKINSQLVTEIGLESKFSKDIPTNEITLLEKTSDLIDPSIRITLERGSDLEVNGKGIKLFSHEDGESLTEDNKIKSDIEDTRNSIEEALRNKIRIKKSLNTLDIVTDEDIKRQEELIEENTRMSQELGERIKNGKTKKGELQENLEQKVRESVNKRASKTAERMSKENDDKITVAKRIVSSMEEKIKSDAEKVKKLEKDIENLRESQQLEEKELDDNLRDLRSSNSKTDSKEKELRQSKEHFDKKIKAEENRLSVVRKNISEDESKLNNEKNEMSRLEAEKKKEADASAAAALAKEQQDKIEAELLKKENDAKIAANEKAEQQRISQEKKERQSELKNLDAERQNKIAKYSNKVNEWKKQLEKECQRNTLLDMKEDCMLMKGKELAEKLTDEERKYLDEDSLEWVDRMLGKDNTKNAEGLNTLINAERKSVKNISSNDKTKKEELEKLDKIFRDLVEGKSLNIDNKHRLKLYKERKIIIKNGNETDIKLLDLKMEFDDLMDNWIYSYVNKELDIVSEENKLISKRNYILNNIKYEELSDEYMKKFYNIMKGDLSKTDVGRLYSSTTNEAIKLFDIYGEARNKHFLWELSNIVGEFRDARKNYISRSSAATRITGTTLEYESAKVQKAINNMNDSINPESELLKTIYEKLLTLGHGKHLEPQVLLTKVSNILKEAGYSNVDM